MKVGDLVLHKSGNSTEGGHGIVLKVYDMEIDHLQDEGSKVRALATVQWFHIPTTMEHRQDRLEIISANR